MAAEGVTRADHVRWCKQRALAILDSGDVREALTSMLSDLGKHDETRGLAATIGLLYLQAFMQNSASAARTFIEGVHE
jgi:hypothetical protein